MSGAARLLAVFCCFVVEYAAGWGTPNGARRVKFPLEKRRHPIFLSAKTTGEDSGEIIFVEKDFLGVVERRVSFLAQRAPYVTLALVTAAWGSQHAAARSLLSDRPESAAAALTAARFGVAFLCLLPWLPRDRQTWLQGLEIGLWAFLGFALQTKGLETTTATRSAFLLYLNVKLVPLFLFFRGEVQPLSTWASALTALLGTALLAADYQGGALPTGALSWTAGDSLSLLAACASACCIVRLGDFKSPKPAQLASASSAATFLLATLWFLFSSSSSTAEVAFTSIDSSFLITALYLGAIPSALCGVLQTAAQAKVPSARAAVVFALDPLWAAFFANIFLHENLGVRGQAGATLVFCAAFALPLRDNLSRGYHHNDDLLPGGGGSSSSRLASQQEDKTTTRESNREKII